MAKDEQPGIDAQDEPEVEGHEITVEEFQAEDGPLDTVCGSYYASN